MFFTGAVGAILMYSVLNSAHQRRTYHEHRLVEQERGSQSISERVAQRQEESQNDSNSLISSEHPSFRNTTPVPKKVFYAPQEVIKEVVVDCLCKCACKAPEKPEILRSFWSLDQGRFVRSAGDKEAKQTREMRMEEIAKMTKYWNLDQGMHTDEKGGV